MENTTNGFVSIPLAEYERLKRMASPNVDKLKPQSYFSDISIRQDDIYQINKRYQINYSDENRTVGGPSQEYELYSAKLFEHGWFNGVPSTEHSDAYVHDVHDQLRHMALGLCGVRKNRDLVGDDVFVARTAYVKMKRLFLQLYEARVASMFPNKVGD